MTMLRKYYCGLMRKTLAAAIILFIGAIFSSASAEVLYTIDFTTQPDGEAKSWLEESGYGYELDARKLDARFVDHHLQLETQDRIAGLFTHKLDLSNVKAVRISWGVNRYPEGADWEKGNYRVPIAVVISIGNEKIDSGALFIPDTPYFISPFLSRNATDKHLYTAKYYKKGGRYVCVPCAPEPGMQATTTINLEQIYQSEFQQGDMPSVSGFGFQMNTKDTRGGASAFLEKVEFLSDSVE